MWCVLFTILAAVAILLIIGVIVDKVSSFNNDDDYFGPFGPG